MLRKTRQFAISITAQTLMPVTTLSTEWGRALESNYIFRFELYSFSYLKG
ncbi:hypothetical protein SPSE_0881 [Staphylococcus pseudintermedius ED99]|nr:hypothetical protein SPSE_0881 [Staphylococcus pseudintermedius ED99]